MDNFLGAITMVRKPIVKVPTEDQEQIKFCVWMEKNGIRFYAIPNGGKRNLLEAVKFKRMGVKSGVPDICLPFPSGRYFGAYLELKRIKGGKVSDNQLEWLAFLRSNGYYAEVANGFEEARKFVLHYLSLMPIAA